MTGLETGELLASQGNKLTFVEMADTVAPGTWFQHLDDAMPKLEAAGAKFLLSTKLVEIDEKGAVVQGVSRKRERRAGWTPTRWSSRWARVPSTLSPRS